MALLLTGDFMDARKACDVGIVAEVTADGQALPTALAMACRIAANSPLAVALAKEDRKSTRLNSSHSQISYAVFCLKKKKNKPINETMTEICSLTNACNTFTEDLGA